MIVVSLDEFYKEYPEFKCDSRCGRGCDEQARSTTMSDSRCAHIPLAKDEPYGMEVPLGCESCCDEPSRSTTARDSRCAHIPLAKDEPYGMEVPLGCESCCDEPSRSTTMSDSPSATGAMADDYKNICLRAFRQAKQFISLKGRSYLSKEQKKLALYLLTAHISTLMLKNLNTQSQGGAQAGQIASASVGEVSISYVQIPNQKSSFDYWLGLTPYGLELLALLDTVTAIPFYVGGSFTRVF